MDDIPLRLKSHATFVDAPQQDTHVPQESHEEEYRQHNNSPSPPPCPRLAEVDLMTFLKSQDAFDLQSVEPLMALAILNALVVKLMDVERAVNCSVIDSNDSYDCQDEDDADSPLSPKKRRWSDEKETQILIIDRNKDDEHPAKSPTAAERSQHLIKRFALRHDPGLTATVYLERIHQYCQYSTAVYMATAYYVHNLAVTWGLLKLTNLNVHRLLIAALRISCKTLEDINHRQQFIAKMAGVNAKDLLSLEITLLFLLKFECQVDREILEKTILDVKQLCC